MDANQASDLSEKAKAARFILALTGWLKNEKRDEDANFVVRCVRQREVQGSIPNFMLSALKKLEAEFVDYMNNLAESEIAPMPLSTPETIAHPETEFPPIDTKICDIPEEITKEIFDGNVRMEPGSK